MAAAAGLRAVVDAQPCGAGRNVVKLAEVSRRTGIQIVCSTGLHLRKYYPPDHWRDRLGAEQLAAIFREEIEQGINAGDRPGANSAPCGRDQDSVEPERPHGTRADGV